MTNAVRMMKESGAEAVKLQGGRKMFDIIGAVADAGVPVMSHVGLLPHYVHRFGGFKMQGRMAEDALKIVDNARAIEEAGAVGLEIEAMPYEVGKAVDEAVGTFIFSIGAGSAGTCQLLNGYDLIGAFDTFKPKFAKRYGNISRNRDRSLRRIRRRDARRTAPGRGPQLQDEARRGGKVRRSPDRANRHANGRGRGPVIPTVVDRNRRRRCSCSLPLRRSLRRNRSGYLSS